MNDISTASVASPERMAEARALVRPLIRGWARHPHLLVWDYKDGLAGVRKHLRTGEPAFTDYRQAVDVWAALAAGEAMTDRLAELHLMPTAGALNKVIEDANRAATGHGDCSHQYWHVLGLYTQLSQAYVRYAEGWLAEQKFATLRPEPWHLSPKETPALLARIMVEQGVPAFRCIVENMRTTGEQYDADDDLTAVLNGFLRQADRAHIALKNQTTERKRRQRAEPGYCDALFLLVDKVLKATEHYLTRANFQRGGCSLNARGDLTRARLANYASRGVELWARAYRNPPSDPTDDVEPSAVRYRLLVGHRQRGTNGDRRVEVIQFAHAFGTPPEVLATLLSA